MVKVFPESGNQSNEMALTICNCFQQMRDWKVENLANVKELFPLFRSEQKKRTTFVFSIQFLNRFSGKLGCLPFSKTIRKFWLKVKWNGNFCGKSDRKLPPEIDLFFRSERNGGNDLTIS